MAAQPGRGRRAVFELTEHHIVIAQRGVAGGGHIKIKKAAAGGGVALHGTLGRSATGGGGEVRGGQKNAQQATTIVMCVQ